MADEDLQIEIDPIEAPKNDEITVDATPAAAKPADSAELTTDDVTAELKRQLAAEKAASEAAAREAHQARVEVHQAKSEVGSAQLQLISSEIENTKAVAMALRRNYSAALANGDYDAVAEINEAMGINTAKLMQLEAGKHHLENQPRQAPPQPADPVERLASQLSPRSAAWVRAHPECARDQRLFNKMVAADTLAQADGIKPDTDEYFAAIEQTLGFRSTPAAEPADNPISEAGQAAPTARRAAPPAAPPSRAGGSNGGNKNVVRLTPEQRDFCDSSGIPYEEYAKNMVSLQREGKLTTH
jgi:rRNA maturation endonuclease Nob1